MALGPSIFLPCNYSGAFIFSKAILQKSKFVCNFDSLVAIVKYDQCSTNALEQSTIISLTGRLISRSVGGSFYIKFKSLTVMFLQVFVSFLVHELWLRFVYGLSFFVLGKFHK